MNKIIEVKKEFKKYIRDFDLRDDNIKRKIYHTYRVMKKSRRIAKSLNLTKEQIDIVLFIALFHDIARFEQFKMYNTFNDLESFDHGDYAVKILEDKRFIEIFTKDIKVQKIIKQAIRNHNKYAIDQDLSEEEMMYSKIIRDADKLDIMYESIKMFFKSKMMRKRVEDGVISESIMRQINNKKTILREKDFEPLERFITYIAFVFDFNYQYTFYSLKRKNYIKKMIEQFSFNNVETIDNIKKIEEVLNDFLRQNCIKKESKSKYENSMRNGLIEC